MSSIIKFASPQSCIECKAGIGRTLSTGSPVKQDMQQHPLFIYAYWHGMLTRYRHVPTSFQCCSRNGSSVIPTRKQVCPAELFVYCSPGTGISLSRKRLHFLRFVLSPIVLLAVVFTPGAMIPAFTSNFSLSSTHPCSHAFPASNGHRRRRSANGNSHTRGYTPL